MTTSSFSELQKMITELRSETTGCAWTRAQDFKSLLPLTLEEVYELQEAILKGDPENIREELGDLLYHIVFYAQIAREQGLFNLEEVATVMQKKHEQRMPPAAHRGSMTAEETNAHWQAQKKKKRQTDDLFTGIPKTFPAVLRSYQMQERAAQVGFDWTNAADALKKCHEEVLEIEVEITENKTQEALRECGDLLFATLNVIRKLGGHPEQVLAECNERFAGRIRAMTQEMAKSNKTWEDYDLEGLEALWGKVKRL